MKNYVRFNNQTKEISIIGIPINRLLNRIDETYKSTSGFKQVRGSSVRNLFNSIDYISWDMTEMKFFSFFALEIYEMFVHLSEEYNDEQYLEIAEELYTKTWISNFEKKDKITTSLVPLKNLNLKLEPFQLDFVKSYSNLKFEHDLDGYILSFEQGLGKTLTSIALAECLKKEIIYIICPNSLKMTWASEIKRYYKKYNLNENDWYRDIFITTNNKFSFNRKNTRFIIINQESIPDIYPFIIEEKSSMIIVDECQNFRGIGTKRVKDLLKLKELTNCKDCLLMSGTPIKALASELSPALRMIDPHFSAELAEIYNKTFSGQSKEASNIVKERFRRVIYRKLKKDTIQNKLPEKYITELKLKIPNPEKFEINRINKEIIQEFHKEYMSRLKSGLFTNNKKSPYYRTSAADYNYLDSKIEFENIIRRYSRAHKELIDSYLRMVFQESEDNIYELIVAQNVDKKYFDFIRKFTLPFVPSELRSKITTKLNGIFGWAIAAKGAASSVMGRLLAKYKNECFSEIWKYNHEELINIIKKGKKKTVIFTALVPTAEFIYEDLIKKGIRSIKITGKDSGRDKLVDEFKNNPDIEVLVATTQTMSLGMTFTEANQILFFGTPYRSADFEQAADRIHRIGQTENCYIYNILLWSREKNITGRIEEILNWSGEMFDSLINEEYEYY